MSLISKLKAQQYATEQANKKEENKITESIALNVTVPLPEVEKYTLIPAPDVPPISSKPEEEFTSFVEEENPLILKEDIPEEKFLSPTIPSPKKDILLPKKK